MLASVASEIKGYVTGVGKGLGQIVMSAAINSPASCTARARGSGRIRRSPSRFGMANAFHFNIRFAPVTAKTDSVRVVEGARTSRGPNSSSYSVLRGALRSCDSGSQGIAKAWQLRGTRRSRSQADSAYESLAHESQAVGSRGATQDSSGVAKGSWILNVVPIPGSLWSEMVPPCCSII